MSQSLSSLIISNFVWSLCSMANNWQGYARPLETEIETFGCWYQKSRLTLRLLVVVIKCWDWDFLLWSQKLRSRPRLPWSQKLRPRNQICGFKAWDQPSLDTKTMFKKELLLKIAQYRSCCTISVIGASRCIWFSLIYHGRLKNYPKFETKCNVACDAMLQIMW